MGVELIGIIIAGLAGLALFHSSRVSFGVLACASLLQAAAALTVGAGGNITPGHLALGFFALAVVMRSKGLGAAVSTLVFPRAGFWLLMATLWSVFTAFIMPRLFFHQFEVYPLAIANSFGIISPILLYPVSANVTQSIYFIGNLVAFMMVAGMCRTPGLLRTAAIGMIVATCVNLAIVVIDQVTHAVGMTSLLDFIRNAEYGQLFHATVLGFKRITGSFPEASSYATAAMGLMAFNLRLWRGGVFPAVTGWLALAMLVTVLMSTSTTAYVAAAAYFGLVYSAAFAGIDPAMPKSRRDQKRRGIFISAIPVSIVLMMTVFALRPDLLGGLQEFLDMSVTSKMESDSGSERTSWNMGGIETIVNTFGLGAGLGSVRTSSFLIGLPANVGFIGTILFVVFFRRVFYPYKGGLTTTLDPDSSQIAAAARSGALGILLACAASGGTADLTLFFFIFAGIASASVFQTVNFDRVGTAQPLPEPYLPQPARRRRGSGVPAE